MLVFEQRCFTTEKRKLLKKYSVYMCIMFYSFRFQKMTKNRIQVLVFISPFFSWSFLASLLQLFLDNLRIYELFHFFNIICIKTTSQWFAMLFSYFGTMMGELDPKWNPCSTSMSQQKTTESSKLHISLFISRWFDISLKSISTKST